MVTASSNRQQKTLVQQLRSNDLGIHSMKSANHAADNSAQFQGQHTYFISTERFGQEETQPEADNEPSAHRYTIPASPEPILGCDVWWIDMSAIRSDGTSVFCKRDSFVMFA